VSFYGCEHPELSSHTGPGVLYAAYVPSAIVAQLLHPSLHGTLPAAFHLPDFCVAAAAAVVVALLMYVRLCVIDSSR
jgi:hypothetical protein